MPLCHLLLYPGLCQNSSWTHQQCLAPRALVLEKEVTCLIAKVPSLLILDLFGLTCLDHKLDSAPSLSCQGFISAPVRKSLV